MSQASSANLKVSKALIGIGGNVTSSYGAPLQTMIQAVARLSLDIGLIRSLSRYFSTPCFPKGAGPDYVNAAVSIETGLSPRAVLDKLHQIEADFGRERIERWGQRTLDLDLLAYGDFVLPDLGAQDRWRNLPLQEQRLRAPDDLVLPHPRVQERAFVLVPLADIAPDWRHPVLGKTVKEMCSELPQEDIAEIVPLDT
ncbi:MAG: 2-amino-4-hydroxy-6-hydroxymethyldihydropteridine diphosphokinase [Pseudoruegeria sp.]